MTSPSEDVYQAAARLLPKVEIACPDPQCGDSTWDHECEWSTRPNHELAKRVVDGLWPLIHAAGVAAGRAQAAADIRAAAPHPRDAVTVWLYDHCAKIADGEPRG